MNLKQETLDVLERHNKKIEDILWIGGDDFTISIDDFFRKADREYDKGYGSQKVATDLKIVGDDWWLERHEYDGSEWWEFKTKPVKPSKEEKIHTVFCGLGGWCSLKEIQEKWKK